MTENKPITIDKKEKIKKEIKEMIPKLANIEFTKDDELEFCKKVLKDTRQQLTRKTQECEELKKEVKKWKKFLDGGICDCETKAKSEQKLKRIEEYCNEQNLKADYTACEILQIIDEVE